MKATARLAAALTCLMVLAGLVGAADRNITGVQNLVMYANPSVGNGTDLIAVSTTYPCTVTSADIVLDKLCEDLSGTGALTDFHTFRDGNIGIILNVDNSSGATASIELDQWDPVAGDWCSKLDTSDLTKSAHTICSFTNTITTTSGFFSVTSLPYGVKWGIRLKKDASSTAWALNYMVVNRQ